jgi:hypothetical protein
MATGRSAAVAEKRKIKVADEVWLSAALLHRENPTREDFSIEEIVERARKEKLAGDLRPGVYTHIVQHCVANRPPNPARYRMLFETRHGHRRLFRYPDAYHFQREGGKTVPELADIPEKYHPLLLWYREDYDRSARTGEHPILALCGLGKEIWTGVDPDEYVRQLREGWE